jgi:hypothetical protein
MNRSEKSKLYFLILAMCALSVALLFISGIVLETDIIGRIIIGGVWLLVSFGWLTKYYDTNIKNAPKLEK